MRKVWTPAAGVESEVELACGPDLWRDSFTSTGAHFVYMHDGDPEDNERPINATSVGINWSSSTSGDIQWRVVSLDPAPSDPPITTGWLPTPWVTVDGSAGDGYSQSDFIAEVGSGSLIGLTIEWDVSGGFTDVCAILADAG